MAIEKWDTYLDFHQGIYYAIQLTNQHLSVQIDSFKINIYS